MHWKGVSRNSDNSVDELNDDLDEHHEVTMNLGMGSDMVYNDSILILVFIDKLHWELGKATS